jgi:hypothetical protein
MKEAVEAAPWAVAAVRQPLPVLVHFFVVCYLLQKGWQLPFLLPVPL